ncbi:DNA-binding protein [Salmonella enterica]|nr:DNA-binding protein [Salmonella enterica]
MKTQTQLMTFTSEELNFSMSGFLYEGKPAFDAVELAKSLGYTNPAKALKDHCKALIKLDYNESLESGFGLRPKGITLAGQADLFRLILRSHLPSAERLQDWVCEEVLPSIMETGSYNKHQPVVESQPQEASANENILSLARVVAEATASATMKAVMEVTTQYAPPIKAIENSAPDTRSFFDEVADYFASKPQPEAKATTKRDVTPPANSAGYVQVTKIAWETTFSDTACRRLIGFASLPTMKYKGSHGLLVHRESFMSALRALIDESTPPTGKLKRWQHPDFGGFTLRKDPKEIFGEAE